MHMGQVGFLHVRLDPGAMIRHDHEQRGGGFHLLPQLQLHIDRDAIQRCGQRGPRQIQRRAVPVRDLVAHHRVLIRRRVRVIAQGGQHAFQPPPHHLQPVARHGGVVLRFFQLAGGHHPPLRQRLLALRLAGEMHGTRLHLPQFGLRLAPRGPRGFHLSPRQIERR